MAQWHNININKNKIITENDKSILISMPSTSVYEGYTFWHLKKLVRDGRNKGAISIGFTNEFVFRLKKYGNGKYNKFDVLDEKEISATEMQIEFKQIDENIVGRESW